MTIEELAKYTQGPLGKGLSGPLGSDNRCKFVRAIMGKGTVLRMDVRLESDQDNENRCIPF
ncbi:hypothetical protein AMJ74_00840 [candidate division WOR_3 bacterium SM1_77]|uniref:Uncharacterized protein n=1 Tax=candidate division WOR_3 bacterium SM1_77 TaxID=1703778 RepID=A0A0S8K2T1_UNCW3|nr:MAG: hypothetical protein AMJ74_00840 [candidate division WOR_3 bacterium SM1_77]